jgi:hypothetical protein
LSGKQYTKASQGNARFRLFDRTAWAAVGGGVYLHELFGMAVGIELSKGEPNACIMF